MKYCPNCGTQLPADATFCNNCGTNLGTGVNQGSPMNNGNPAPLIAKREIVVAILLSLVTCGIYGIYWFITMTDESNKVSGDNSTSGGMAFLLTLVTCGIYGIYWYWKMGQKLYLAGKTYNKDISDNSVLYLILGLFGLGIVAECLIQNDLNKFAA